MLVVADSSPLNFIIRLGCADVLPSLFGAVLIPPKVEEELTRSSTPAEVRSFVQGKPAGLRVRSPRSIEHIAKLDPGEEAAISLAREVRADAVLIDDGDARKAAAQRGLAVIGLLGILERADERALVQLPEVLGRLPTTIASTRPWWMPRSTGAAHASRGDWKRSRTPQFALSRSRTLSIAGTPNPNPLMIVLTVTEGAP